MIAAEGLTHHPLPLDFQEIIQDPEMQSAITTFAGEHKAFSLASEIINKQFSAKWSIGLYALSEKVAMKAKEDGAGTITAMVNQIERSATKFA